MIEVLEKVQLTVNLGVGVGLDYLVLLERLDGEVLPFPRFSRT